MTRNPLIRRRASVDVGSALLSTLGSTGVALVVSVLVARTVGPTGKGVVSLLAVSVAQVVMLVSVGVDSSIVHFAGRSLALPRDLAGAALRVWLWGTPVGLGLGLLAVNVVFARHFPANLRLVASVATVGIPFTLAIWLLRGTARGCGRVVESSALSFAGSVLLLFSVAGATIGGWGVPGILIGNTAAIGVTVVLWVSFGMRTGFLPPSRASSARLPRSLLMYGIRGHIGTILQGFNYRFDLALVGVLLSTRDVGLYSVTVAAGEAMWILPNVLGIVLMQRAASDPRGSGHLTGVATRITSVTLALGAGLVVAVGSPVIHGVFGRSFAGAVPALWALLPGIWALGVWKNLVNDLVGRGHPQYKSYSAGAALVVTIVLDLLLIPPFGLVGAGVASSAAYAVALAAVIPFFLRTTGLSVSDLFLLRLSDFGRLVRSVRSIVYGCRTKSAAPPISEDAGTVG